MTFRNDNILSSTSNLESKSVKTSNDAQMDSLSSKQIDPYRKSNRKQCDLCFSLSNLALIVASITGLFFLIFFYYDEPLYSNLDVLLSANFFRQLVFITVIIPLVLLIPIFNAISGLVLRKNPNVYTNFSLNIVKIVYISVLAILIFIGLIFTIPYVREIGVISELEIQFLYHMSRKYVNGFSYQFLDSFQSEHQCCDLMWYRANQDGRVPISCYKNTRLEFYDTTCPIKLGRIISFRCKTIAISLLVILISLIALVIIGICELMGQEYDVANREDRYRQMKGIRPGDDDLIDEPAQVVSSPIPSTNGATIHPTASHPREQRSEVLNIDDIDDVCNGDEISERLGLHERERQVPLLLGNRQRGYNNPIGKPIVPQRKTDRPAPILTRANFTSIEHDPKRSPNFVDNAESTPNMLSRNDYLTSSRASHSPSKSSLKKAPQASSSGSIESDELIEPGESESVHEYLREVSTRRSSMNVRFNIK